MLSVFIRIPFLKKYGHGFFGVGIGVVVAVV